jgi:EF hand
MTAPSTDVNCAAGSTPRISPRLTPNDGTLDKNEFLALVEKRFKAADPDNDGTIDAKELKSAAGRSLVRLLK